jgi:exodeoxyribonuclease VIII
MNIMLDLETLSSAPDAAIVAIGACTFNLGEGAQIDRFYCVIDAEDAAKTGGTISASTFAWWTQQSEEARSIFHKSTAKLSTVDALGKFSKWVNLVAGPDALVWGNGSDFDNVVLRGAYERLAMKAPWSFRYNRCYRTLKGMSVAEGIPFERIGVAHDALDDALSQANHAKRILDRISKLEQLEKAIFTPAPSPIIPGIHLSAHDADEYLKVNPIFNPE